MPAPQASETFYTTLQRYQLLLIAASRRLWRGILPGDIDGSWLRVAPQLAAVTAGAQLAAATAATAYVPAVLDETGQPDEPSAVITPRAFAGVAYDGRPLASMLAGGVRTAKARIATGVDADEALVGGRAWLERALRTAVADAARDATAAQIAVRERMGWVRVVNPPCCSRCAVLAGRWYRWNEGFLRHPGCDCFHVPSAESVAGDFTSNPAELVRRGLVTDLTAAQMDRLDDGADLGRVLNESRDRWRQNMVVQRRAADRRAARRAGNGLVVPQGWGAAQPLPPGGLQDFLSHLTSRVDALSELKAHGIAA